MPTNLTLADRLREGLAADIWYDAAHHGDQAAAAKIEDAQDAMQEAAVLLSRTDGISPLPLLYVRDADNDHDLLVRAPNAEEALKLWRTHYELEADELPTYIGPVPLDVPGAIDWDAITTNAVTYKPFPD